MLSIEDVNIGEHYIATCTIGDIHEGNVVEVVEISPGDWSCDLTVRLIEYSHDSSFPNSEIGWNAKNLAFYGQSSVLNQSFCGECENVLYLGNDYLCYKCREENSYV